jgi:Zn-dependent protease/predicted transcriptional regulator
MFGKKFPLFNLLGFTVWLDLSWFIIAVLVTWSLAEGFFPAYYENLSRPVYWWMGVSGALGLFASVVFHELSHSLVARGHGLHIKGITLFIFGGVAELEEEPRSPKSEFLIAIVGPISSLFLALAFYGLYRLGQELAWAQPIVGVAGYLAMINGLLAAFNLVPGFPLDGGRVLRSALWGWKRDLRWATRLVTRIGSGFGLFLIILGVLSIARGAFIAGFWQFLIGMFLRGAAMASYQQLLTRQSLEGEPVRRFMKKDPVVAPAQITVQQLVEDYFYRYYYKMFPVAENGALIGYVSTREVKELPRDEWPQRTLSELAKPLSQDNTVGPEDDALKALAKMNRADLSRLLVVDQNRLVGIITLKDLLSFLSLRVELEERLP